MSLKLTSYKGTRDLYPEQMAERRYIFDKWRYVVERYGYQEYAAPMLEPLEVYAAKSGEEIVNEQTYSFTDRGGRQMVIRPEMTPSIARMVAARRQELPMPARLYSIANFMRYERPQHGREREFWQLNFDLFGVATVDGDREIIKLSHDIVRAFGATDDMFTIKVNDRRLTNYLMCDYLGLDKEQAGRMIKLLDRFDKLPRDVFDDQAVEIVGSDKLTQLTQVIEATTLADLPDGIGDKDVAADLRTVLKYFAGHHINNVVYDVRLMRGFDYYTGIVFEVFDEAPQNRRAMFGGGRYDGLVSLFGVETLPVVGAAPGETMFREFLLAHDLMPNLTRQLAPDVIVLPMADVSGASEAAELVADVMRQVGLIAAVDYTDRKLDKKTRVAIKRQADWLVYVGEQEVASGKFTVKHTTTGNQTTKTLAEIGDYIIDSNDNGVTNNDDENKED